MIERVLIPHDVRPTSSLDEYPTYLLHDGTRVWMAPEEPCESCGRTVLPSQRGDEPFRPFEVKRLSDEPLSHALGPVHSPQRCRETRS